MPQFKHLLFVLLRKLSLPHDCFWKPRKPALTIEFTFEFTQGAIRRVPQKPTKANSRRKGIRNVSSFRSASGELFRWRGCICLAVNENIARPLAAHYGVTLTDMAGTIQRRHGPICMTWILDFELMNQHVLMFEFGKDASQCTITVLCQQKSRVK
jgi:hypothetical protein